MDKKIIIGITGTLGAGKGEITNYLKEKGFRHFSVREFLIQEIKKRGLIVNRDSMVEVANDLRQKNSPSFIVEQLYQQAQQQKNNTVIESLRCVGEVEALKEKRNFYLLAVDADPEIRYQRIVKRQSETDQVDFETFLANEKREMGSSDPNKQNLSACMQKADFVLTNNGTLAGLHQQIDNILDKILYAAKN